MSAADVLDRLGELGLPDWEDQLRATIEARTAPSAHGDMARWTRAMADLPAISPDSALLTNDVIRLLRDDADEHQREQIRQSLLQLSPWRKGPFDVGGVFVDSEWRSDMKWRRVKEAIDVSGRRVLDVGCGNGYYGLRMVGAGARTVLGIDPTLLYVMQFRALKTYLPDLPIEVLPLRLAELPDERPTFDAVFSMGVLYHQRSPMDHLLQLRRQLLPGGELLLETLVLPGDEAKARTPPGRYARMRNVWALPTAPELETWLQRAGFRNIACHGTTRTGTGEQRSTEWMPFESLREALDPADPALTVEGWPAPTRAVLSARS